MDPDAHQRTSIPILQIAVMQRDALINTREFATRWSEEPLVPDLAANLADINVPTLVIVGELDMKLIHDQAAMLADQIPPARVQHLENTAHAPTIERPEAFNQLVVPFLANPPTAERP